MNGDVWKVTSSKLSVISASDDVSIVGYVKEGDELLEQDRKTTTDKEGKVTTWIKVNRGWVKVDYDGIRFADWIYTAKKDKTLTIKTNSDPPLEDEGESTGYLPDIESAFAYQNLDIADSEFVKLKNISGVLGLPYQFLPIADPRLSGSNSTQDIGYEYGEKIIERIPLLFLAPGKASFMTSYSKKDRENILESIFSTIGDLVQRPDKTELDNILDGNGRYFTFEYDQTRFYKFLNPMCRIAAQYLNIDGIKVHGQRLRTVNWELFTQSRIQSIGDFSDFSSIPFYIDADTSISESFGNATTQSMLASSVNSVSDMGRELQFLLGQNKAMGGVDIMNSSPEMAQNVENIQNLIGGLLGGNNFLQNLGAHFATVAAGGKLIFPEIWSDSSFSHSYSCKLKFVSPDASKLSVYLNVLIPLFHLIALTAPQSTKTNPNGYINPFLIRASYKGFFNVDMGIITSMSVTKGAECQWTPEGVPTSIEVDIDIKDLYEMMSITETDTTDFKYDTLNNTALMDYIANLCGINIYKPEVSRQVAMWIVNNLEGRIKDIAYVDIWGGIQQRIQNTSMNLWMRALGRK